MELNYRDKENVEEMGRVKSKGRVVAWLHNLFDLITCL